MSGAPAARSTFVTTVAWIFIVLGGFTLLISLLQNVMIFLLFPVDEMRAAMREADKAQPMPAGFRFVAEHFHWFFAAFLVVSAATFVSAIGLLRRRNWARCLFIGVMAFGILWNLPGLAMPFLMSSWMPPMPDQGPPEFQRQFTIMFTVIAAFTIVISLATIGLFGWIIKRLVSPGIRKEFH